MKRHLFWIVELFIWILILFAVSGGIMFAKYNHKKNLNAYQIFLPDIDGLISGSPVRMLGIQVGYVNQVNIVGEDVYVRFIITDPKVKIPYGATATVEFSGLGGAKSLEIYPPKSNIAFPERMINPQSPKRIHDSLGVLYNMYNEFMGIAFSISHFTTKMGAVGIKNTPEGSPDELLEKTNKWLDNAQSKTNQISNSLNNHHSYIIKKYDKDENDEREQN